MGSNTSRKQNKNNNNNVCENNDQYYSLAPISIEPSSNIKSPDVIFHENNKYESDEGSLYTTLYCTNEFVYLICYDDDKIISLYVGGLYQSAINILLNKQCKHIISYDFKSQMLHNRFTPSRRFPPIPIGVVSGVIIKISHDNINIKLTTHTIFDINYSQENVKFAQVVLDESHEDLGLTLYGLGVCGYYDKSYIIVKKDDHFQIYASMCSNFFRTIPRQIKFTQDTIHIISDENKTTKLDLILCPISEISSLINSLDEYSTVIKMCTF